MASSDISTKLDDETAQPPVARKQRAKAGSTKSNKPGQTGTAGSNSELSIDMKPHAKAVVTRGKLKAPPAPSTPAAALTKTELVLKLLRSAKGASIQVMMEATGWQPHSVRGFLSATVKKKLGLTLTNETGKDGVRRYKIA